MTKLAAVYRSGRLSFRRSVIEPLALDARFRIVTPGVTSEMSKAEFLDVFADVVRSRSYRGAGCKSYVDIPAKAQQFTMQP